MDVEKAIEFILDAQAKLSAYQIDNAAAMKRHDEAIAQLDGQVAALTDLVGRLAQAELRFTEQTTRGFEELRDLHARTEYKLNALIDTVDKLVRRNGGKAQS